MSNNKQQKAIQSLFKAQTVEQQALSTKIWRGTHTLSTPTQVLDTGYPALNEQLHDAGWPLHSNTELGLQESGIGELRLLLPALRDSAQSRPLLFINPPFIPFAPALLKEQIDPKMLTIVNTPHIADALWACEQALLADCCAAVISWTNRQRISTAALRRIQLATERSHTWNVLIRHNDCLQPVSYTHLTLPTTPYV